MDELNRFIEKRQAAASVKQLTVKLICIVKYLGEPIVSEGISEFDSYDDIQEYSEDADSRVIGYLFNKIFPNKNIEIKYTETPSDLRASCNGYTVYQEVDGELVGYIPHEMWEDTIEHLYKVAKKKEKEFKIEEKEEKRKSLIKQADEYIKKLRNTWGI